MLGALLSAEEQHKGGKEMVQKGDCAGKHDHIRRAGADLSQRDSVGAIGSGRHTGRIILKDLQKNLFLQVLFSIYVEKFSEGRSDHGTIAVRYTGKCEEFV